MRRIGTVIYKPAKGLWEVRLTVGYSADGKRISKSQYISAPYNAEGRRLAEQALAAMIVRYGQNSEVQQLPLFGPWIQEYVDSRTDWRPNSMIRAKGHLALIQPRLGHLRLQDVSVVRLEALYHELARTRPQNGRNHVYSKATITKVHQLISQALDRAVRYGYLPSNPARLAKLPKSTTSEVGQALSQAQQQALLNAAAGHRLYPLLYLTLALGLRRGEALGLRWSDVEWPNGEGALGWLRIERAFVPVGKGHELGKTKTSGSDRVVPLSAEVVAVLRSHQEQMRAEGQTSSFMFVSGEGTLILPRNFVRWYKELQVKAGLYREVQKGGKTVRQALYRLHDLRVTSETEMIRATGNPKLVATFHGQRSVVTAVKHYHKVARGDLEQAANVRTLGTHVVPTKDRKQGSSEAIPTDATNSQKSRTKKAKR